MNETMTVNGRSSTVLTLLGKGKGGYSYLVSEGRMKPEYLKSVQQMYRLLYPAGLNIDYYPTNFVVQGEQQWYIDYECNLYDEKWNFENWGSQYWKSPAP